MCRHVASFLKGVQTRLKKTLQVIKEIGNTENPNPGMGRGYIYYNFNFSVNFLIFNSLLHAPKKERGLDDNLIFFICNFMKILCCERSWGGGLLRPAPDATFLMYQLK